MSRKVHPILFRLGHQSENSINRSTSRPEEILKQLDPFCFFYPRITKEKEALAMEVAKPHLMLEEHFRCSNWSSRSFTGGSRSKYSRKSRQENPNHGELLPQQQHTVLREAFMAFMKKLGFLTNRCIVVENPKSFTIHMSVLRSKTKLHSRHNDLNLKLSDKKFSDLIEKFCKAMSVTITNQVPLRVFIVDLDKAKDDKTAQSFGGRSQKRVANSRESLILEDISRIVSLSATVPVAHLIASFLGTALSKTPKHQRVFDLFHNSFGTLFPSETLGFSPKNKNSGASLSLESDNWAVGNIKGVLIQVKGCVQNSDRSQKLIMRYGSIPLSTVNLPLDYGFSEALTPGGTLGVKVWLCYNKPHGN